VSHSGRAEQPKYAMEINENIIKRLNSTLPGYLTAIGRPPYQKSSSSLLASCPLHEDHQLNLLAELTEDGWFWYCDVCETGGCVIDLYADLLKLDQKSDILTVCRGIVGLLLNPIALQFAGAPFEYKANTDEKRALSREELKAITNPWRHTLYTHNALRKKFATSLGLTSEELKGAAYSHQVVSMGIAPQGFELPWQNGKVIKLREPRIVDIGDCYYKVREPFGDGRGPLFLMFGMLQPQEIKRRRDRVQIETWRREQIQRRISGHLVRTVACPYCTASAGDQCVGYAGCLRTRNHMERVAYALEFDRLDLQIRSREAAEAAGKKLTDSKNPTRHCVQVRGRPRRRSFR